MSAALLVVAAAAAGGGIAALVLIAHALHAIADAAAAVSGAIRERNALERKAWEAERRETRNPWEDDS